MLMEVVAMGYVVRDVCQLRDCGVVFAETKLLLQESYVGQ